MPEQTGRSKLAATLGATAAAAALAIVGVWEGKSNDPYRDIVGVWTVCYGETRVDMRRYTNAECEDMLAGAVGEFGEAVLARNPNLRDKPYALAAATSLSYNIGQSAYARSTVARRFSAGNIRGGCDAFLMWNKAGGREVRGLTRRRQAERALCLKDAA
ncbi:glycoside hydrolase family protein [Altererythrobacter buctensis]|uniref:Lysozyme n=2 Tax=Alteraurantiacibacter buctensis TaxID=1503981 RepID=A0A844Z0I7_9SPHN|nr:glycoside hydrolase family protein [Alteraurantiacibacter buctensis]